ncbi:unnamed protein product [Lactuca virosa]|uniref:tryptophan synthase n=1 Tax=Lactuca virosa TaxID=75947 RepID=A0AAU9PDR4_9ASTR|nr:unnamed protein product [Lactuca virosa]
MQRNPSSVQRMKLLGAQVKAVDGNFQAAVSESTRSWIENLETGYYLAGTAVGPHPIPTMVREFYSVIGKETRKQAIEKWGGVPDVLVACVGTGCNALGLFHEFIGDESVRMIGIEGGGVGSKTRDLHSASLVRGEVGVYHGAMCYSLQDGDVKSLEQSQWLVGILEFPGVSPELSFLKDSGRLECYTVTDQEALDGFCSHKETQGPEKEGWSREVTDAEVSIIVVEQPYSIHQDYAFIRTTLPQFLLSDMRLTLSRGHHQ